MVSEMVQVVQENAQKQIAMMKALETTLHNLQMIGNYRTNVPVGKSKTTFTTSSDCICNFIKELNKMLKVETKSFSHCERLK